MEMIPAGHKNIVNAKNMNIPLSLSSYVSLSSQHNNALECSVWLLNGEEYLRSTICNPLAILRVKVLY
jgi:hypothetical protein